MTARSYSWIYLIKSDLNNFDDTEEREWKGYNDDEDRKQGQQMGADARAFFTGWKMDDKVQEKKEKTVNPCGE